MALTTEQVRALVTSAAWHASYLYGYDEHETEAQVSAVGADFDKWLERQASGRSIQDFNGEYVNVAVGDKIQLIGSDWDDKFLKRLLGGPGSVHEVVDFDSDNDPFIIDTDGEKRYACCGEENQRGWLLVERAE